MSDEATLRAALPAEAARPALPRAARRVRLGLSLRLLLLTVVFVLVAEVLIYVPAVANFRRNWLSDRVAAAQVAALVIDAAPQQKVSPDLARRLLAGVGARAIAVKGGGIRRLLTVDEMPDAVSQTVDLRETGWPALIAGAARTLTTPASAPLRVVGRGMDGADFVEIVLDEPPLRAAMLEFSRRIVLTSILISGITAGLVFLALQLAIVRPVRRLSLSIAAFAEAPEDVSRRIVPSGRSDEIGVAETALAGMEDALAGELRQRRRLADLGLSVSKINHELRNLLTTAQLLGDRLEGTADPTVRRVAPRLVATIGRAVRFCEATLAYGRAAEPDPRRRIVTVKSLVADLPDLAALGGGAMAIRDLVPADLAVEVDPEQIGRALVNLVRNAVQALTGARTKGARVTLGATREGNRIVILVADNGPGLPARTRAHLFEPFQASNSAGGTGLGLPIAAELVHLNGGTLTLDEMVEGTRFRITLPAA